MNTPGPSGSSGGVGADGGLGASDPTLNIALGEPELTATDSLGEPQPLAPASGLIDEAVREQVRRGGLAETLFVEAGAGSGKTTLLVDRIVNLVLEAGVQLSSIAAITFTEAAASELQSRIRAKFEQVQSEASEVGDEARADLCRSAVADTDLAAITTLHGFANRILGEFAVAAGLPPQIRVLDEVSSQLAHEDRWQRFVDRLYDNDDNIDLLQAASALQIPVEPRYVDQSTMRTVAVQFNQNWDRLQPLIDTERVPLGSNFDFSAFDDLVDELVEWRTANILSDDKLHVHMQQRLLPEMRAVAQIDDPLRKLRALTQAQYWGPGNGGRKEAWQGADTVAQIKATIKAIEASKQEVLGPINHDVLMRLSQVIAVETYAAAQARRADGGLEFHDLLVLARDVLRTSPEARRALHDRYRHVLLDEFQDTDPIQIELAVLIATSAVDVQGCGWSELPVEPGRLFFVGDSKQSIYRFRRADIALFLSARDRFASGGSSQLQSNFRTVRPIVEWVNALFDHEMPAEEPGAQPKYQPLTASRDAMSAQQQPLHRPVLLGGPHENEKIKAAELRAVEAEDVVGVVRAIMADPEAWPVQDKVSGEWRPARMRDITMLLPTRTSLPFLRAALDEAELRYRIVTGTLVYDTQEVVDALAALRAIDDPGDELSLVAALRSPLYACSDVDLMVWRTNGGRWDVRAPIPESIAEHHPVAVAVVHLRELWHQRWFLTPSGLLERLLRERHAALLAFGDPRTTDVWRRLRFLVEQARAFEEANSGDLRAFTQWAALQGGSMARVHEPLLPETDEEAISIQTIHGSKGLEFPITILSGMTTQLGRRRGGVSVLWPDVGLPSVSIKKGVETHEHGPRADIEAAMDDHEKVRLAYVATTRARDHLIVSCHHKADRNADKTYGGKFWQIFDDDERRGLYRYFDWREIVGGHTPEPPRSAQLGLALDNREQWVAERAALLAPYSSARVMSATGVAQAALVPAVVPSSIDSDAEDPGITAYLSEVLVDQDDDGSDQPVDGLIGRRRGRTGSAIGSAVHGVLQRIDLHGLASGSDDNLDDLVVQQCEVESIPDRTGIVFRLVRAALSSQAVALAGRHVHHKELFVTAPVQGRTIEGYVDLLIETPDGLVVVDYKTDSVRSEEDVDAKLGAYELQAAAYAVALHAVTGLAVVECRFVFCTATGAIERSVADVDGAMERVRSSLAGLG